MENVAIRTENLYQTLHWCDPTYRQQNQGTKLLSLWLDRLNGAQTIFEHGCGNGEVCEYLSRSGYEVTGMDIVDGPYQREGYQFLLKEDIDDMMDRSFDAVLSFDVIEHLEEQKAIETLQHLCRMARQMFIFVVACYGKPPFHLTVRTPGWWLNQCLTQCPEMNWQILAVVERHKEKYEGLYAPLFYGTRR